MITRTVDVDAKWDCISTREYLSNPHLVKVKIRDTYKNTPSEELKEWATRVAKEVTDMMCKRACGSISDSVFCNNTYPETFDEIQFGESEDVIIERAKSEIDLYEKQREQKLLKEEQKKEKSRLSKIKKLEKEKELAEKEHKPEKVEQKEIEIEAVKEDKPIPVIVKKELTGTDIAHIHSSEKKISKINETIQKQTKYLNVALGTIERTEESGRKDLLLGAIISRDRALDNIKLQNEKIKRLQESITKIRGT